MFAATAITLDSFALLGLADHVAALRAYRHRIALLRAQLALAPSYEQGEALSTELGHLSTLSKLHLLRAQELRQARIHPATEALLDAFQLLAA